LPLEDSHAVVQAALAQPEVIAASRRIKTGGMVGNREGNFPITIIGIEAQQEARVNLLAENIAEGRYLAADDEDLILIGRGLANRMDVGIGPLSGCGRAR
jgi:ABC-type lipoprotein release transport system permease subunit